MGIITLQTFSHKVEKLIISYDTLYLVNLQPTGQKNYAVTVLKKEKRLNIGHQKKLKIN